MLMSPQRRRAANIDDYAGESHAREVIPDELLLMFQDYAVAFRRYLMISSPRRCYFDVLRCRFSDVFALIFLLLFATLPLRCRHYARRRQMLPPFSPLPLRHAASVSATPCLMP